MGNISGKTSPYLSFPYSPDCFPLTLHLFPPSLQALSKDHTDVTPCCCCGWKHSSRSQDHQDRAVGLTEGLEKHYLTTLQTENPKSLRQAILALKPYKDPTFLLLTFVFIALALDKLGYQLCDSHLCVCCHTGSSCVSVLTGHLI